MPYNRPLKKGFVRQKYALVSLFSWLYVDLSHGQEALFFVDTLCKHETIGETLEEVLYYLVLLMVKSQCAESVVSTEKGVNE